MFKKAEELLRAAVAEAAKQKGLTCRVTVQLGDVTGAPQAYDVACQDYVVSLTPSHVTMDPVACARRAVNHLAEALKAG